MNLRDSRDAHERGRREERENGCNYIISSKNDKKKV